MPKPRSTRRRVIEYPPGYWKLVTKGGSPTAVPVTQSGTRIVSGSQVTDSEGHHWPPPKGTKGDVGGDFYTSKSYLVNPNWANKVGFFHKDIFDATTSYSGFLATVIPGASPAEWPPTNASSKQALWAAGTQAIARCKPTSPPSDLSTFLGELYKEGIPSLIGSEVAKSKTRDALGKSASEYLNIQFGYIPIANEVAKFLAAVRKADEVLAQFERDAGRLVRRKYTFPSTEKIERSTFPLQRAVGPPGDPFFDFSRRGALERLRITSQQRWFSGAFTYHLPSGYDSRNALARFAARSDIKFGAIPDPETLWNVSPWSWAIDWFTNTGDVISNLSDYVNLGLVMPFGYMMEHTIVTDTWTLERTALKGQFNAQVAPVTMVTETKQRVRANPFGFGVTWEGLSPFQASIAVALGLTKTSR